MDAAADAAGLGAMDAAVDAAGLGAMDAAVDAAGLGAMDAAVDAAELGPVDVPGLPSKPRPLFAALVGLLSYFCAYVFRGRDEPVTIPSNCWSSQAHRLSTHFAGRQNQPSRRRFGDHPLSIQKLQTVCSRGRTL